MLGEYAVLAGAPAMVLAVDRRCRAQIGPSEDASCHLTSRAGEDRETVFSPGGVSGLAVVDGVLRGLSGEGGAWRGRLDSSDLFAGRHKLGLGSSAAALTAWAGAWAAYSGQGVLTSEPGTLETLVGLHKTLQGGAGSGLDVAASLCGGGIEYRLSEGSRPAVSSVGLPNGVGFAGVFVGSSASTPDYLARYDAWRGASPEEAADAMSALAETAEGGIGAARADDTDGFLAAVREYGSRLDALGGSIGAEIVTREHRGVIVQAERYGIAYKVSGAGGGDLGLAFSADTEALEQFKRAVAEHYDVIEFAVDPAGLSVERIGE